VLVNISHPPFANFCFSHSATAFKSKQSLPMRRPRKSKRKRGTSELEAQSKTLGCLALTLQRRLRTAISSTNSRAYYHTASVDIFDWPRTAAAYQLGQKPVPSVRAPLFHDTEGQAFISTRESRSCLSKAASFRSSSRAYAFTVFRSIERTSAHFARKGRHRNLVTGAPLHVMDGIIRLLVYLPWVAAWKVYKLGRLVKRSRAKRRGY